MSANSPSFTFNGIIDLVLFGGALWRIFLPSHGISMKQLYVILYIAESPVNVPRMTKAGFYSDANNTYTGLKILCSRGFLVKIGITYHLSGKGEAVCLQFLDFCRAHGVAGE